MAYTKVEYNPVNWKNKSEGLITPLDKRNLNNMDDTIKMLADSLDVAYNELDVKKLDAGDGYKIITEMPTWDEKTGILKFKFYDGTEFAVDFNVEKIPVSFSMDEKGTITMVTEDGTEWTADVGTLTPNYVYDESERIAVTTEKSEDGFTHVKLDLKKGSITDDFLANNYLSSIIAETLKAQTAANDAKGYADNASQSASNAEYDAKLAQSYAIGDSGVRDGEDTDNAKYYKSQASAAMTDAESARDDAKLYSDRASSSALKAMSNASSANDSANSANASATSANASAESASASATSASESEKNASASAASASASEKNAKESKESAGESATSASTSANNASVSATNAAGSATSASVSATSASASEKNATESATNAAGSATSASVSEANAKTYYEQTKAISESFAGTLRPKGTVTFAKLPSVASAKAGDMYNISDEFTTTTDFAEGAGNVIPLGSNVYKNSDGKWDVLAGSPVTGVKGSAETTYRRGNVNITKESIGLDKVENTADSEKKVSHASTANSADSAGKATNDSLNQTISSTYVKGVSITDHTLNIEKGDGKKTTYTIPDNDTDTNTTYTLTQDANDGHKLTFKASDGTTTNITIPDNDTKYDLNTMINGLGTADSTPTDSNYLLSQSGTDTGYKRTPFSKILDYLKSKFSYNDLKDKPTIGNGTVTIKQNGTQKASFSMNQTGSTTVELTDTNTNTWRGIQDNLTSTSTTDSLSANQGKWLNENKTGLKEWVAVIKCATWSRLCYVRFYGNIIGSSFILNISATRNSVVYNDTFAIKIHHNTGAMISKLSGSNYGSPIKLRIISNGSGDGYVEIYENNNGATNSTSQAVYCSLINIAAGTVTAYTTFTDGSTLPTNFTQNALITTNTNSLQGNLTWEEITSKPSTFTPSSHKQAYTASECDSYTTDDNTLGVTPAAVKKAIGLFEPKAHTHDYLPLAGGTMSGDITFAKIGTSTIGNGDKDYAGLNAKNNLNIASWWGVSFTTSCIGGSAYVDKPAVSIDCRNGTLAAADKIYANGGFVGDLTGNAATATNASKVNNHTVNADVPSGAKFTDTNTWRPVETVLNTEDLNAITTPGFYSAGGNNTVTNKPSGVAHFGMYVVHRANGSYYTQILLSDDKSYRRHCENGTWGAWKEDKLTDNNTTYGTANASTSGLTKLYTSTGTATDGTMTQDAIKSALDGKANSSHTHTKSQITDFPSSMPASDVYSWAKASSKPSYNWSEINNKPTIPTNTNQLTNGAGFITGITKEMVTGALGYTPANSNHTHNSFSGETKFVYSGDFVDPAWGVECAAKVSGNFAAGVIYEDGKKISEKYLTDITADNVKTALGYTPTRIRSSIFSGTMGTSAGDGGRIGSVSFGISAEDSGASVRILNFESNYSLTQCGDAKTSGTTVTVNVHSDTITSGSPSFGGRVLYVVGV